MTYVLLWTPSTSKGVEYQDVSIEDLATGQKIAGDSVPPTANGYNFECPDGLTIKATVTAVRGDEKAGASVTYQTPAEPLRPPTDLEVKESGVVIPPPGEGPTIQPLRR